MKISFHSKSVSCLAICILIAISTSAAFAKKTEWKYEKVDLRLSDGIRIKGIKYPKDKPVPIRGRKKATAQETSQTQAMTAPAVVSSVIDTPPIDGFIPWIAVVTTDKKGEELDLVAVEESSISGTFTTASPTTDYAIRTI